MGDAFIRSGQYARCLVVAAEIKSRSLDPGDESTAPLFGDGAGAVVLTADRPGQQGSGIWGIRLRSDGSRHGLLQVVAGAPLFRVAVKRLAEMVTEILEEFGLRIEDVSQAVFHQANWRLLRSLAERIGLPAEKLCTVIEQFGNTSSASLPIALDQAVRGGRIRSDDLVLLGAFGGGLTWGAGVVRWS
jgi:3-oxoacyl-[acyl-carrier-protein] synthase-3